MMRHMTTTRTRPLDVRPAEVMQSPWGKLKSVRVVHSDGRLIVAGQKDRHETEVETVDRLRGTWTATTTEGDTVTFRRAGGCSCGKPWLKGSTASIING